MKIYNFVGKFDIALLRTEILVRYPWWRTVNGIFITETFGIDYDGKVLVLNLPDDADDSIISTIIDHHDPTSISLEDYWNNYRAARTNFQNLPNWSTWTADEANTNITNNILSGQTKAQVESWIDTNVTTLATAKTALKLLADAIIDIRDILAIMAKLFVWLRDIVIRR